MFHGEQVRHGGHKETKWMVLSMECAGCGRRWVAVAPIPSSADAECPGCHEMRGRCDREGTKAMWEKWLGEGVSADGW